jgi:hypothetical protein
LEEQSVQQAITRKSRMRWLGAACIVALLGIGVFFINENIMPKSSIATVEELILPAQNTTKNTFNDSANLLTAAPDNAKKVDHNKAIGSNLKDEKSTIVTKKDRVNLHAEIEARAGSSDIYSKSASAPSSASFMAMEAESADAEVVEKMTAYDSKLDESAEATSLKEPMDLDDQLESLKYKDATVYTNRVGTTFKKEEHEMLAEQKAKSEKEKKKSTVQLSDNYGKNAPAGQSESINPQTSGYNAYIIIPKTTRIDFPLGDQYACDFAYITLTEKTYRIEYCKFVYEKPLTDSKFLSDLYQQTNVQLQNIGKTSNAADCKTQTPSQQLTITIQHGYQSQAETIDWKWNDACTSEINSYVGQFRKLLELKD